MRRALKDSFLFQQEIVPTDRKKDEELSKFLVFFSLQMSIDELTASHHELKPYGFMI